jgi:hypothetical protein
MSLAKPTVDQRAAEQLLREAIAIARDDSREIPGTEWDIEIRTIIEGKHLTFRYILVTALEFQLIAEKGMGSLWLEVTGPNDTAQFLLTMFGFDAKEGCDSWCTSNHC